MELKKWQVKKGEKCIEGGRKIKEKETLNIIPRRYGRIGEKIDFLKNASK